MSGEQPTRTVYAAVEIERLLARPYKLTVARGPDKGVTISGEGLLLRIGSASDNDLILNDDTVSRHHCVVELEGEGTRIRDLGSKNGVVVEGIPVRDGYLPDSCRIVLGESELKYRQAGSQLELELTRGTRLGELVGSSTPMRHLFALIQKVAATDATVLIEGESGTGKELVARALHELSERKGAPFEIFDCSAVPEALVESELFGHLRGAFTGAVAARRGIVEAAAGGTLLLDEIGELPPALQGKILRFIERREIRPVGADGYRPVALRILAATNRVLRQEVAAGNFREDLFFRLNVIRLRLPPLRERPEEIPLLADHFLDLFSQRDRRHYLLSHSMLGRLAGYDFPGNVRELRNIIERSCLLSDGIELEVEPMPRPVDSGGAIDFQGLVGVPYKEAKDRLVTAFEKYYWQRLLAQSGGNVSRAAELGGIHRKSLEYLMKKFRYEESDGGF